MINAEMFRKKIQKKLDERKIVIEGKVQSELSKEFDKEECIIPFKIKLTDIKEGEEKVVSEIVNVLGFSSKVTITGGIAHVDVDFVKVSVTTKPDYLIPNAIRTWEDYHRHMHDNSPNGTFNQPPGWISRGAV